ncbi:MAG: triose-phosphate isomerase [Lentisphaerae bacterium]|nr:triose-phosphate isomerase [Lentisphaerota bacterium]
MKQRKLFIAGNWKMNKTAAEAAQMVSALVKKVEGLSDKINMAVCPPFTALDRISPLLKGTGVALGAQNLSEKASGAYTGEISAAMLLELGVKHVIIGHSERRQYYGETDELVSKKAKFALAAGLLPIVCVGETLQEREGGKTSSVITAQLKGSLAGITPDEMLKTTIAYEPVWAIGTGKTASPDQAQEVHALIRKLLTDLFGKAVAEKVIIQYGGSVKADNARELMAKQDIDGALVGGASLDAEGFSALIRNAIS